VNRRKFLKLTTTKVAGPLSVTAIEAFAARPGRVVDAGPATKYANQGVHGNFRDQGFFLVRKGARLVALSAFCTPRKCKLTAEPNRSFYCNCHGSTFDSGGKVTAGPARHDLPILPTVVDGRGHLLVTVAVT
jgi:Rieske Fe-S protein